MQNNEKTIEIIYDGKPVALSEEEAVSLAQKGMNYDRLYEKYNNSVNALDELAGYKEMIDLFSEKVGVTPKKALKLIEKSIGDAQVADYSAEENIPEEYARKIMELKGQIDSLTKEKDELIPVKKRQEDMENFNKEYPEIAIRDIDKAIIDEWHNSDKTLIDVYNSAMVKKLLREKNADMINEKNKSVSCGSVAGTSSAEKQFTTDDIRKMSDEEIEKNFEYLVNHLRKEDE